jgi:hypothetical protein
MIRIWKQGSLLLDLFLKMFRGNQMIGIVFRIVQGEPYDKFQMIFFNTTQT